MCVLARELLIQGDSPPQNAVEDIGSNSSSSEAGNFRLGGRARTRHTRIVVAKLCPGRELPPKMSENAQLFVEGSYLPSVWATGFKSGGRQNSFRQPPDRVPQGSRTHFCRLLVLAVVDQVVDHRRIGQRRRVTEIAVLVFSDLAQDSSHDFAGPRFRQAGCELDQIR